MSQDLANVKNHNKAISDTLKLHQKGISDALEKNLDFMPKSVRFQDQQITQNIAAIEIQVVGIKNVAREQNSQL